MVFTAMATDFYPRLSAMANDNERCNQSINQQADISLLILSPVIMVFLVFINWIIIVLYSTKFLAVNDMILWAALGILFKAASWPVGFIFVPKGDSKIFIINEVIANAYMLLLNLAGYYYFGLKGLGISFLVSYILYFIQVLIVTRVKYNFNFDSAFRLIFTFQFSLAVACFVVIKTMEKPYSYIAGVILIVISFWYSLQGIR